MNGDAFQQHDSRLQEGVNAQYIHLQKLGGATATFTAGTNFHDNQINVGLYPRIGRDPLGATTRANAHVTNEAGYGQETLSFWNGRLILGAGLRYDEFRYNVLDRVTPENGGLQYAGRWQGKGNVAFSPIQHVPLTFTLNYGRGINSIDARRRAAPGRSTPGNDRLLPVWRFIEPRPLRRQRRYFPDRPFQRASVHSRRRKLRV